MYCVLEVLGHISLSSVQSVLFDKKCIFFSFRHRVSTSKEMVKKDRQSIAFFVHFDHRSTVIPIKNLEAHPINAGKVYSEVKSDEYVRGRLNNTIKK